MYRYLSIAILISLLVGCTTSTAHLPLAIESESQTKANTAVLKTTLTPVKVTIAEQATPFSTITLEPIKSIAPIPTQTITPTTTQAVSQGMTEYTTNIEPTNTKTQIPGSTNMVATGQALEVEDKIVVRPGGLSTNAKELAEYGIEYNETNPQAGNAALKGILLGIAEKIYHNKGVDGPSDDWKNMTGNGTPFSSPEEFVERALAGESVSGFMLPVMNPISSKGKVYRNPYRMVEFDGEFNLTTTHFKPMSHSFRPRAIDIAPSFKPGTTGLIQVEFGVIQINGQSIMEIQLSSFSEGSFIGIPSFGSSDNSAEDNAYAANMALQVLTGRLLGDKYTGEINGEVLNEWGFTDSNEYSSALNSNPVPAFSPID